jgi:hypothetical protein
VTNAIKLPKLLMKVSWAFPLAASLAFGEDSKSLDFDQFEAKMKFELGHIVNGENREAGHTDVKLNMMPLYRDIIVLQQSAKYEEAWTFDAGLKWMMWWPFSTDQSVPLTRTVRIEPRLSLLKLKYDFTSGDQGSFLEAGFFPYKYNRDAVNLGEYLYRSGTYPGIVYTSDGYQLMDHACYDAYGAHFRMKNFNGLIQHDANLFMEVSAFPIGDFTPAYELSVNLPWLQLGAGAAYNRGISFAPSKTHSKRPVGQYVEVQADAVKGTPYYKGPAADTGNPAIKDPTLPVKVLHSWTQRGIKVMARAALDFGSVLPDELRGSDDLRLYTEVAVLGWENQPYYYEKRSERMPIMVGLNFPTFRLLDLLAVQVEYYASPFNGIKDFNDTSTPIWTVGDFRSKDANYYKASNWKWSLNANKTVNRLLKFKAQIANDHLRPRVFDTFSYTNFDLTQGPKNWYYLVQMEVGI